MDYGPKSDGSVSVGSLELLGQNSIMPRLEEWDHRYDDLNPLESEKMHLSKTDDPLLEDSIKAVKDVRLVVMNPPFTNRTKQGEKFPKETQQKMRTRADSLEAILIKSDPEMSDFADKNSISPLFVALADRCLDEVNGILSVINPTIAITTTSGLEERKLLAKRFHIHTILTSHVPGQVNLSQDTGINESILIAHRLTGKRPSTRIISLDRVPLDESEVADFHQSLLQCPTGLIPNGWGEVSEWPTNDIEEGDWSAAVWRSPFLAIQASKIAKHEDLHSLQDQNMVPAATGRVLRGEFKPAEPNMPGSFSILKSKGANAQMNIKAIPDANWILKKQDNNIELFSQDMHPTTARMLQKAGYLLITAGQDISSARLTAVASDEKYVGNGWMPIANSTPDQAKAAAVFLNSTAGRLQIMRYPGKKLQFPSYSAKETANIRIPDLSDNHIVQVLTDCWERTSGMEVPQFRDGECKVRRLWDEAVATALGWDETELSKMRHLLHKEPFVRGIGYNQYR